MSDRDTGNRNGSATPSSGQGIAIGLVALLVAALVILPSGVRTPESRHTDGTLDLALQQIVDRGAPPHVRVIVSARSGRTLDAALAVTRRGGRVLDRFDSIGAVTTVVQADELLTLAADPRVRNLSSDGAVASAQFTAQAAGGNSGRGGVMAAPHRSRPTTRQMHRQSARTRASAQATSQAGTAGRAPRRSS